MDEKQSETGFLEDLGHTLTFSVREAALCVGEAVEGAIGGASERALSMRLTVDDGDVRLPDKGRTLNTADWSLYLREDPAPVKDERAGKAIGVLVHSPQRTFDDAHFEESCGVSARITPHRFSSLLTALQAGRLPRSVNISVKGMEIGWEPDGSGIEWDVEKRRALPVVSIQFGVPLASQLKHDDDDSLPLPSPATTTDVHDVTAMIRTQADRLVTAGSRLVWIIVAAIVISGWLFSR